MGKIATYDKCTFEKTDAGLKLISGPEDAMDNKAPLIHPQFPLPNGLYLGSLEYHAEPIYNDQFDEELRVGNGEQNGSVS